MMNGELRSQAKSDKLFNPERAKICARHSTSMRTASNTVCHVLHNNDTHGDFELSCIVVLPQILSVCFTSKFLLNT